jgi:BirA family biotin operon repressor/biotin-[acetyl-CoA-carboxylase] ligase
MATALASILEDPGRIVLLDEVDSTNDEAKRRLEREEYLWPEPPYLITARRQIAGRGRGSNAWYADEGSLTETYVFEPSACGLRPDQEPLVALAYGVCLIRRIERAVGGRLRAPLEIRWPNDLEAGGRKWGGLLVERFATRRGSYLLVGVGLNVTTNLSRAPREVSWLATTLDTLGGGLGKAAWDRALAQSTFWALDEAVDRLVRGDATLAEDWMARDALRDVPITAVLPGRTVVGTGAGIDAAGHLRIASESGVETIGAGVIAR